MTDYAETIQNTILVADTDAAMAQTIKQACGDLASVTFLQDGYEALDYLKQHTPKLVFAAEELSQFSGKHLINGMRYTRRLKEIPAVLITEDIDQTFKDASQLISKRLEPDSLFSIVKNALANAETDSILSGVAEDPDKPHHIFVAEGSETVSALLTHVLTREGYQVTETSDAETARQVIEQGLHEFDLAILDVNSEGGMGFELLEMIKLNADLPVLILSALQDTDNVERSIALGAQDFIPKPFNPKELVVKIKAQVN